MAEQQERQTPDLMELWRDWLTQSERQVNAFTAEAMNNEAFARTAGGFIELYAAFHRFMNEAMQRYLAFINVPSRTDVVGLGEMLRSIEDRLARIEETLQIAAQHVDGGRPEPSVREPARTRVPPGFPGDERGGMDAGTVPEQLRR